MNLWTIGHSTLPIDTFSAILQAHQIERLVDVRTVPRSRHNPQFNRDTLPEALGSHRIAYLHMPGLGGLRHPRKDSPNTAWRNDSFRGYADYMATPEFARNLDELAELSESPRVCIMCAEAVPWRCHRSLIADALTARGCHVQHILSLTSVKPHTLTSFARLDGNRVSYPGLPVPTQE